MNKLSDEKRAQILTALIEGNSIAATCRMTGAAKMTVLSLIREVGAACLRFHDAQVRHLSTVERVQCDEVWSFCYSKQKNVPEQFRGRSGYGSVWTWTAIDADSKLMISWMVSDRNQEAADALIRDLKKRTFWRVQISTDGLPEYFNAILKHYRYGEADHGEIIKTYASSKVVPGTSPKSAGRYSPGRLMKVEKRIAFGQPLDKHISTSFMERWNLTLRMQNRRFTRLTNGFSKKLENHCFMLAITMVFYNFCRKHRSLQGRTPAMAAGITKYVWTASDLLALDMWHNEAAAA